MRIIVTKDGDNLVNLINEEVKIEKSIDQDRSRSRISGKKITNLKNSNISISNIKGSHSTNSLFKNTKSSYTLHSPSPSNDNSINKTIDIKQKKVTISKDMIDKYIDPLFGNKSTFLPTLPSSLSNKHHLHNNSLIGEEENLHENDSSLFIKRFKMTEILSNKTLNNLQNELHKKQRIKDKMWCVGPNDFRSIYKEKDDISLIKEKLENITLTNDKINLIKYINSKDNISEKLIDKLDKSNEDQLQRYNKICQIVSNNKEKENFLKLLITDKIKVMKKKEESEMSKLLSNAERNLNDYKQIMEDYSQPQDIKRYRYYNIHNDIRKNYWNKYNLERFNKRKDLIERSNLSVYSFN
jgi:hypothetical protein